MRALSLICIGIAAIGLLAYYLMGASSPPFLLPLIVVSSAAAAFFIVISIIVSVIQNRKTYQCLTCGITIKGFNPLRYGNVCPNCGGNAFR
jgi:zinc transporter ZupT